MYSQKLSVNKLKTDMSYQSPVKDAQVKKIVKDFDPQKLHTIVVNRRNDMNFYIIDGQHRVEALKELGIPLIEATVHEGLTIQQEADMYFGINDRPTKSPISKGKAKLTSGDKFANHLDMIVNTTGMRIDYENAGLKGTISAYGTLERILKKYGSDILVKTLNLIQTVYGDDRTYYQGYVMEGFAKLLYTFEDSLKMNELIKRLKQKGFNDLLADINQIRPNFSSKKECLPVVVADIYNKRRRKSFQLDKRLLFI